MTVYTLRMSPPPSETLARDGLVRLRWGTVLGEVAAVAFATLGMGLAVPWLAVGALLAATVASNLGVARIRGVWALPAALLFDLAVLTALLALTGGASNPFSVLYLLHVALAAVVLGPRWTWICAGVAAAGFAALFPFTDPHAMHRGDGAAQAHLTGMWLALVLTGAGIAWFVARLARELREREDELARLRRRAEQQERVLSLATLAAGAAHELGSPLGVIAVAAREVEALGDGPVVEEARAIREQVERCRGIVARLTQRAGASVAEPLMEVDLAALWGELRDAVGERGAGRMQLVPGGLHLRAPRAALVEALASLVRNGLQASAGRVRVTATRGDGVVAFRVEDEGEGMSAEVLARAGEPFFTTRPAGEGMGLGLFLVQRFADSLGGALELDSAPGAGARVTLRVPA